jgi:hypothetical protein
MNKMLLYAGFLGTLFVCGMAWAFVPGDGWDDLDLPVLPPPNTHGPLLAYDDCGDGTIVDLNTGLMWEKKEDFAGPHDVLATYTWSTTGIPSNGTLFTEFQFGLNSSAFAGYTDWRIPHMKELITIVDYSTNNPAIDPAFGPTVSAFYWTATSGAATPRQAWMVGFLPGDVQRGQKIYDGGSFGFHARAVREGLCPS